jgi:hypothetical protein
MREGRTLEALMQAEKRLPIEEDAIAIMRLLLSEIVSHHLRSASPDV